jgi:hypothetical protein
MKQGITGKTHKHARNKPVAYKGTYFIWIFAEVLGKQLIALEVLLSYQTVACSKTFIEGTSIGHSWQSRFTPIPRIQVYAEAMLCVTARVLITSRPRQTTVEPQVKILRIG